MDHFILMINSLQIAMHIPLFSSALPGNVILFLQRVIDIVMFDIVKEEWKINPTNIMEFDQVGNEYTKDEQARMFPGQMQEIGYENHNFIQNVGSLYLFIAIYIFKLIILGILKLWSMFIGKQTEAYKSLFKQVIFSDLLILFLEGYMELCIAGFIRYHCVKPLFSDNLPAEIFSDTMCVICISMIVLIIPCFLVYTVTRKLE